MLAGEERLRYCVGCLQHVHLSCLRVEERQGWRTYPDMCPDCTRASRPRQRGSGPRLARQAVAVWQPYRWPPYRSGVPLNRAGVAVARMSFFYVPLILAGLSCLPGAPPSGYLRRDDVVAWRLLLEGLFARRSYVDSYRGRMALSDAARMPDLSFDGLAYAVSRVLMALFGPQGTQRRAMSQGTVQEIHDQMVDRTGYVAPDVQEAILYINDAVLQHSLCSAGSPEVLAYMLAEEGYSRPVVGSHVQALRQDGMILGGSIGIRWQQCQCQQCTGVAQLSIFMTCDGCGSICRYLCSGLSTLPLGQWTCRGCRCLPAYPPAGHDSYLRQESRACIICAVAVDAALCWQVAGHTHSDATVCTSCAVSHICRSRGRCWTCDEMIEQMHVRSTSDVALSISLANICWSATDDGGDHVEWGRLQLVDVDNQRETFGVGRVDDVQPAASPRNVTRSTVDSELPTMFDEVDDDNVLYDEDVLDARDNGGDDEGGVQPDDYDPAPVISDDASDAAVWVAIEEYALVARRSNDRMRNLIARLRRRPRNVPLAQLALADTRQLQRLYALWYEEAMPTTPHDIHSAFTRLLRAVYTRHRNRWRALLQSVEPPIRRTTSMHNVARRNGVLLSGRGPTVDLCYVGVLRTGDPEVDSQHTNAAYLICAGCEADILQSEVISVQGRRYGRYCCLHGQVALRPLRCSQDEGMGNLMRQTFLTRPERLSSASLVRRHGRLLNSSFAMSCQAVRCRPMLTRGMQSYVVNTRIAHFLGSLLPDENEQPQFAQLYVYDAMHNVPVGGRPLADTRRNAHRNALQSYFARSRTTPVGRETQTALLAWVDAFRDAIYRVCCHKDCGGCDRVSLLVHCTGSVLIGRGYSQAYMLRVCFTHCRVQVNPYARSFVSAGEMLRRTPQVADQLHLVIRGRHDGDGDRSGERPTEAIGADVADARSSGLFREVSDKCTERFRGF